MLGKRSVVSRREVLWHFLAFSHRRRTVANSKDVIVQGLADRAEAKTLRERAREMVSREPRDQLGASFALRDAAELERKASAVLDIEDNKRPSIGAGGELVPQGGIAAELPAMVCTVDDPSGVTVEASRERLAILMKNDCAGLALDTAETIQAQNSLEKMLAHQMAQAHKLAMNFAKRAGQHSDKADPAIYGSQAFHAIEAARAVNASVRMMDSFQRAVLALNKIRSGGRQTVTVQHVNISDGGQAVVTGGINAKEKNET